MTRRPRFFYGWVVVGVAFLTSLTVVGIRTAPNVLIVPFEAEFGWSRASIGGAIGINLFLLGLAAPISGQLVDRFGPRAVMMASVSFLALAVVGTTLMTELWQLYLLWGLVAGLAAGGSATVISATVATRWFVERLGLVIGVLNTASSTGQLIFIPSLMGFVVTVGWRTGTLALAGVAAAMLIPILLLMRNRPSDVGLMPYGATEESAAAARREEGRRTPLFQAIRTPEFAFLAGSFFICGATTNGLVGTHLIPHSIDHGIPAVTAAATVGVMGLMNIVGTMTSGWLTDRTEPRKLLAFFYGARGLSLFVLPFVQDFSGLLIFAVIYGLDWFATVPPTVALIARRFGVGSVGTLYGWVFLSHQTGGAFSAYYGGVIRVWLGDYQMAFITGACLALLASGMALLVRIGQPTPAAAAASPAPA